MKKELLHYMMLALLCIIVDLTTTLCKLGHNVCFLHILTLDEQS